MSEQIKEVDSKGENVRFVVGMVQIYKAICSKYYFILKVSAVEDFFL